MLLPLIEQGVVPTYRMVKEADKLLESEQKMMKPVEVRTTERRGLPSASAVLPPKPL